MNDWTQILGEDLSKRSVPENEIGKYAMAVTKDAQVIGHLIKGNTGQYTKSIFDFLWASPMNTASIPVKGKRVNFGNGQDHWRLNADTW